MKSDRKTELFEKTSQCAQLLLSDVQELYSDLVVTNPLAAELFREQVLTPAAKLEATLKQLDLIAGYIPLEEK